jgi:1-acyl-sn-glycerol-3-phosphate acyltransferase
MIRTIILAIYLVTGFILSLPSLLKVKSFDNQNKVHEVDRITGKVIKRLAKGVVSLSGARVSIRGKENLPETGPVLFVSNHQSYFDIPILIALMDKPLAFIAKMELSKIPMLSTWMKYMHCVFMDRKDVRQSLKAINKGVKFLKEGYSLVIFPEGTRSEDGSLREFKPGALKLATKSKVPIVPVTIKGAYKIMPRDNLKIRPADVEVIISEPIFIDDEMAKDSMKLSNKVRHIIEEELNK